MKPLLCLTHLVLLFSILAPVLSAEVDPLKSEESIVVGDETRSYVLIRPETLDPERSYPVIFGFHGYRGEVKSWLHDYARFEAFVAEKAFIIVYPTAPIQWTTKVEGRDVRFFDALLEKLKSDFRVDAKRIYLLGHSNGASFASYLVQVRPDVVAAAALHSGILSPSYSRVPIPEHKAPLLVFWGEKDEMLPASSDRVKYSVADFERAGFEVEMIVLPGWGHSWGGEKNQVEEKILTFFRQHPFQDPKDGDK